MRNLPQEIYLIEKFEAQCKRLKETGYDLSKIKIVMANGHKGSYLTKRIMEELNNEP